MTIKYLELILFRWNFFLSQVTNQFTKKMCEIIYGLFGIYCIYFNFLVVDI